MGTFPDETRRSQHLGMGLKPRSCCPYDLTLPKVTSIAPAAVSNPFVRLRRIFSVATLNETGTLGSAKACALIMAKSKSSECGGALLQAVRACELIFSNTSTAMLRFGAQGFNRSCYSVDYLQVMVLDSCEQHALQLCNSCIERSSYYVEKRALFANYSMDVVIFI